MQLSEKSHNILKSIADGHPPEQILTGNLELTYHDIFRAAAEALECLGHPGSGKAYSVHNIRKQYKRAYVKWSATEDAELAEMHRSGLNPNEIAQTLERQPGAIQSRLTKLNLIKPT